MPKFFVPKENILNDKIIISGEDVSHIKKVLRMNTGDGLTLCDGKGINYDAVIDSITDGKIECRVISENKSETEANIEVTLFQGIPKAAKTDYIIQKTTELGIVRIVPVAMSRCVAKIDNAKDAAKKQQRWQKIAQEAAKQSGRGIVPVVDIPISFDKAVEMLLQNDIYFSPYECEEQNSLKSVLTSKNNAKKIGFIIGPEGGFDLKEIEKLKEKNIPTITLGKRILRTETAGEAVLAMTMYELGDINR